MNAIIFGINGQDGYYLKNLLEKKRVRVIGVSRSSGKWVNGNVGDFSFVETLIKKHKPDYIFHLAAISTTKHVAVLENHKAISTGTLNILENVKKYCPRCRVFLSGSAMQFKNEGKAINEKTPFEARSPYAVERIQSVYAGRYYRDILGIKVYIGYFFNHDSPVRPIQHVSQEIVSGVKRIKMGSDEKLNIGNIEVKKEFNFAGDIVKAIWILVNQDKIFEVVIGSGKAYSLKDWTKYCFDKIGKNWKDYTTEKKDFVSEYKILISDPKLIMGLGWKPEINFYQLADMMMEETK